MKKLHSSIFLAIVVFSSFTTYASSNWERGFERRGYNRIFVERVNYNYNRFNHCNNYYQPNHCFNHEVVVYHPTPVVVSCDNQYGPRRISYYFYPRVNVYFNPINHLYIYPFRGTWVTAAVLPKGFVINEPYREVYCGVGENIWAYNNEHIITYRRAPIVVERGFRQERIHEREGFRGRRF